MVAAVRLDPKPATVIVAPLDDAVNLYHTPYVVVLVAPPQLPVGAAFPAPCRLPVVVTQVVDGLSVNAPKQSDCAFKKTGANENKKTGIRILTKRTGFIKLFWLRTRIIGQRSY